MGTSGTGRRLVGLLLLGTLASCASRAGQQGSATIDLEPPAQPVPAAPVQAATPAAPSMPPPLAAVVNGGSVRREDLLTLLQAGIPTFLSQVQVDAERADGRFIGWRLLSYNVPEYQAFIVQPGDLIVRVNQHSLERPEQLMQVWEALKSSSQVVFDIVRGDQPSQITLLVTDDSLAAVGDDHQ